MLIPYDIRAKVYRAIGRIFHYPESLTFMASNYFKNAVTIPLNYYEHKKRIFIFLIDNYYEHYTTRANIEVMYTLTGIIADYTRHRSGDDLRLLTRGVPIKDQIDYASNTHKLYKCQHSKE